MEFPDRRTEHTVHISAVRCCVRDSLRRSTHPLDLSLLSNGPTRHHHLVIRAMRVRFTEATSIGARPLVCLRSFSVTGAS